MVTNPLEYFVFGNGRRNKLVPDTYTREKLALEHRHQLLHEAEQERKLAGVQNAFSHSILLSLVGRLGIALGTRLQRREQGNQALEHRR
jgi:hypothetical protein